MKILERLQIDWYMIKPFFLFTCSIIYQFTVKCCGVNWFAFDAEVHFGASHWGFLDVMTSLCKKEVISNEKGNTDMRKCDIKQTIHKTVQSIHPDDSQWQQNFQTPTLENTLTQSLYSIKALTLSILFYLIYGEEKWKVGGKWADYNSYFREVLMSWY